MNVRLRRASAAALLLGAAACGSPSKPSVSVSTPSPVSPANTAQIRNSEQPVTLTVANAVTTATGGGSTYGFEVATDAAFANKVQTKDGVPEGNTQTALTLAALAPASDYYWHARATNSGTVGGFGSTYKFTIGPAIALSAPAPVAPLTGAQTGTRPTLIVTDAGREGSVGAVVYKFEIAANASFSPVLVSATVPEAAGQTSYTATIDLGNNQSYVWRATAIDQTNNVSSSPSTTQTFTVNQSQAEAIALQEGAVLWSGVHPPGNAGQATLGANWGVQTLVSFNGVTFVTPTIDALRVFDLIDRGMAPDAAIAWMNSNGYPTDGVWYPGPAVVGFPYQYIALVGGHWDMVIRVGG